MTLVPHLWEMVGYGVVTVMVEYNPPVSGTSFGTRKALARHCESAAAGIVAAGSGRPEAAAVPAFARS